MELGVSGLASGFDWRSLVDQLANVERAPQALLQRQQSSINSVNSAYGTVKGLLTTLQTRVTKLNDASLFTSRTTGSSDATVATASADKGASFAKYTFAIGQLATTSTQQGGTNAGSALNATSDVSALVVSNADFATPVTAGTFTVNGKRITIATTDTLQAVFDGVSTATSGAVTGAYDPVADKFTLTGTGTITLGSAADTSNFLTVARLNNNGTNSVTSSYALGTVKLSTVLASANFSTPVSDGGSGAGSFKINGVAISFSATGDSTSAVLARINDSAAGVTATYDSVNDQFLLTNKTTGDLGVALEDVTGNFLAATRLSTGTLARGKNLEYTINGGGTLVSNSNTITSSSSGLTGLTVSALKAGSTTVDVKGDTATIKTAITDFLAAYNQVQSFLDTASASTTDSKGKVTAGVLAGQTDATELSSKLRRFAAGSVTGLTTTLTRFADLGITTTANNNQLTLSDSTALDTALATKATDVQELLTHSSAGLAAQLNTYLTATVGETGTLIQRVASLTKQSTDIDSQVTNHEQQVQRNRAALIRSFVAMETAQAKTNQQLQFLKQQFG